MIARQRGQECVMKPGIGAFSIAIVFLAGIVPAHAQDHPSRSITVINREG